MTLRWAKVVRWATVIVACHVVITWIRAIRRGSQARRQMAQASWRFQQMPAFRLTDEFQTGALTSVEKRGEDARPAVSILVPAWCESGTIEKCIGALQKLDYPTWEALILAGGPDGTYEAARRCADGDSRFRVIKRGAEPKNAAINRGTVAAQHEIVVLLDADSVVEPDWLTELVEPLTAGASASFGMHYPSKMTWVSAGEYMEVAEAYGILGTSIGQGCSSLAVRRDVLERIGPLPETAYSWEDADVGMRLAKAGEKVAFAPAARLRNERPATLRSYWSTAIRIHRAHIVALWHWRSNMIRNPGAMLFAWYFHLLSACLFVAAMAGLAIAFAFPASAKLVGQGAALGALWMFLRRASLGTEIAAYTGETKWLWRSWIPPVQLLVQLITSDIALLTVWKAVPFDYKGHRESETSSPATE
jgi:cellulose synthase/poly-beta-1,6-N-acetylglucosamine synthase-like glycosyltransferase